MQDCTLEIATMTALTGRKRNSTPSTIWEPKPVMIPRMPAPVDMATGEMIKLATLEDAPDLQDEDAARKLIEHQNHAA